LKAAGLRLCRLFHYGAARRAEHWNHWVEISTGRCATVARTLKSLGAILRWGFAPDQRKQRLILTVKINTARGRFRGAAARNPGAHDTHLIDFRTKTVDASWLNSLGTDRCPLTVRTPAKYRIRTVRRRGRQTRKKCYPVRNRCYPASGICVSHFGKNAARHRSNGGTRRNSLIAIGGGWVCKREVAAKLANIHLGDNQHSRRSANLPTLPLAEPARPAPVVPISQPEAAKLLKVSERSHHHPLLPVALPGAKPVSSGNPIRC
jgi:hypothetical protein